MAAIAGYLVSYRCLGPVDVLLLGLGSILGAGAFVLTGVAAHDHAG